MYRLPFGDESGWSLNNGNHDDPSGISHGHGKGQYYAIDFNHPVGGKVRAARGDYVVITENSVDKNVWNLPDSDPDKAKFGAGNYVLIRHIDGTVSAYDHFKKGSVLVQKR